MLIQLTCAPQLIFNIDRFSWKARKRGLVPRTFWKNYCEDLAGLIPTYLRYSSSVVADAVQLATRQRGFEHVPRIDLTFRLTAPTMVEARR